MKTMLIGGKIQYRIKVNDTWYITKQPLSDFKAEGIWGRATRVWETYMEDDPAQTHAIKDIWLNVDERTEGDIWRELKDTILSETFMRHFMTVVRDGPDANPVTTLKFMQNRLVDEHVISNYLQVPTINTDCHANVHNKPGSQRISSVGTPTFTLDSSLAGGRNTAIQFPDPTLTHQFQSRCHYRVAFKEVCIPLHKITDMYHVFKTLLDTVKGLFQYIVYQ
jgi:hypothetical protein